MMEGPSITHPFFKLYFGIIKKFTPSFHKCPYKKNEEMMLKNLTIDYNLIPTALLLMEGHFKFEFNSYSTKLGESIYYFRASIFFTIQKRFPYKKRAKTSKN
jgi:hypothetical protein